MFMPAKNANKYPIIGVLGFETNMALVCDDSIKSDEIADTRPAHEPDDAVRGKDGSSPPPALSNEDLEDGEIEDDEDEQPEPEEPPAPEPPQPAAPPQAPAPQPQQPQPPKLPDSPIGVPPVDFRRAPSPPEHKMSRKEKKRHEKKHLTEAEKSVMRLHKLERMEREKYRREQQALMMMHQPVVEQEEDFAMSLEKALAKVLKKDKTGSDDENVEEKPRGKKRKKKDKHKKNKKKMMLLESPKSEPEPEDFDPSNRPGTPFDQEQSPLLNKSDEDSYDSESSSDKSLEERGMKRKHKRFERGNKKFRDRSRERSRDRDKRQGLNKLSGKRNTGVCLHYLQGLCDDENCQYSHEIVQPMKLELCKFYLLDCCAKGDKCLYMHSDFPCKYYHTGLPCPFAEGCKFAHGGPLTEGLKQILFKHIETAPKEILGNFPRLSRENASLMITQAQKGLETKYGPVKKGLDQNQDGSGNDGGFGSDVGQNEGEQRQGKKEKRNRPSRWQDPDPIDKLSPQKPFGIKGGFNKDQDMRIIGNGDVDMRTLSQQSIHPTNIVNPNILQQPPPSSNVLSPNLLLPNLLAQAQPNLLPALLQQTANNPQLQEALTSALLNQNLLAQGPLLSVLQSQQREQMQSQEMEVDQFREADAEAKKDVDIRMLTRTSGDSDLRQLNRNMLRDDEEKDENGLQVNTEADTQKQSQINEEDDKSAIIESLPKTQRDLYKRIQAQQKEKLVEEPQDDDDDNNDQNIDWYSDDEDDNKLTIKDDFDEGKHEEAEEDDSMRRVDLSKIDISPDITKLLSTIQRPKVREEAPKDPRTEIRDPRLSVEPKDPRRSDDGDLRVVDPRRSRNSSVEERVSAVSIYDQGIVENKDVDLRGGDFNDDIRIGRPDVDLRQLNLPFKGMQNYTPATEIDASMSSHAPLQWKVVVVEIPKPDYTGLKLSATEAQTTGDPRLRKIFRLSTEEKDSPASPKESPKAQAAPTVRVDPRRKKMEAEFQPPNPAQMPYAQQMNVLQSSPFYQQLTSNQKVKFNQELSARNDQSGQNDPIMSAILQNLGLVSGMIGGQPQTIALSILANINNLAFAPNQMHQNMGPGILGPGPAPDFPPMGFDPRMGNNGPPPQFGNFPPEPPNNFGGGYNDDFYDQGPYNNPPRGNDNRVFRDNRNRRGGRGNNRGGRNFFRRNNRNNRNSPP